LIDSVLLFVYSENASFQIEVRDNIFVVTESGESSECRSVCFELAGVRLLPATYQQLQPSSDQTVQLRLGLKEVIPEDFSTKCAAVKGRVTDIEVLQAAPFYYRCRKCGTTVLDRHL